jgi:hypothetical protein
MAEGAAQSDLLILPGLGNNFLDLSAAEDYFCKIINSFLPVLKTGI